MNFSTYVGETALLGSTLDQFHQTLFDKQKVVGAQSLVKKFPFNFTNILSQTALMKYAHKVKFAKAMCRLPNAICQTPFAKRHLPKKSLSSCLLKNVGETGPLLLHVNWCLKLPTGTFQC
jgi:hypothetical protein